MQYEQSRKSLKEGRGNSQSRKEDLGQKGRDQADFLAIPKGPTMTSLMNNPFNNSQKKLPASFSTHRTKTLKKNENNPEITLNLNAKTKNGFRKNNEKKQIISTFEITKDIPNENEKRVNKFSNIDLLKDSTYFGNPGIPPYLLFAAALNCLGFEGADPLDNSFLNHTGFPNLKRVKRSPSQDILHIDPPHNFFEELTPELLNSRVMQGGPLNSIRDNESLMYFFDIKQPSFNKSLMFPKNMSSQVLSPSRIFENRRPPLPETDKIAKFDPPEDSKFPEVPIPLLKVEGFRPKVEKIKEEEGPKRILEEGYWNKEVSSPLNELNQKSKNRSRIT